jgi:hypothetical protein
MVDNQQQNLGFNQDVDCSVIFDAIEAQSIYHLVKSGFVPHCDLFPKEGYCESQSKSGCVAM